MIYSRQTNATVLMLWIRIVVWKEHAPEPVSVPLGAPHVEVSPLVSMDVELLSAPQP